MNAVAPKSCIATFLLAVALAGPLLADVELVTVDVPQDQVWVGQKASVFVKLRGKGSFAGAAAFSLPQIPRAVILKVGNPVVSSEEIDDASWFVQTHEFALFSQVEGVVEVPSFGVRFANRDGFTGPVQDHQERVPEFRLQVERPPGSDPEAFLVTTDSLTVEERWGPSPGEAEQGAVFHRTITQQADQVSGMALAPPPLSAPEGVRVHVDDPEIEDKTARGDFTGIRTDRVTYVLERAGTLALPAVKYVWWKPEAEQYGSITLPAATFQVTAIATKVEHAPTPANRRRWGFWLIVAFGSGGIVYWQQQHIARFASGVWRSLYPPERRIARRLLYACRSNDANTAQSAWREWQTARPSSDLIDPAVRTAVTDLQRQLYGTSGHTQWDGSQLAAAFKKSRSEGRRRRPMGSLPPLNPTDA